jgi:hypothetical protein
MIDSPRAGAGHAPHRPAPAPRSFLCTWWHWLTCEFRQNPLGGSCHGRYHTGRQPAHSRTRYVLLIRVNPLPRPRVVVTVDRFPSGTISPPATAPPGQGVLRRAEDLPAVAARQQASQPGDPYGRDHPDPAQAQRRPRLLPAQDRRGEGHREALRRLKQRDQRRHLRPPARRRPPGRSLREGPGRATGEPLCLQGGRLTPRAPALRTSHSLA